jgi:myo-inositol-1(or 4)-monophosphatase
MDGCENFARAMPFFALSVAIEEQGKTIACAVYNPILDKLFFAENNGGAFVHEARMTRRIRVSRRREAPLSRDFGCPSLSVCYVASGMLDKYAGPDTPASLIVREAGGKVEEKEGLLICSNGNF